MRAIKITAAALGAVIGTLGSLACVLTWLGVKPEDLRMTGPHWIWLFYAVLLFVLGITPSIVLLYRNIRGEGQKVKELELEIVTFKNDHENEINRLNKSHDAILAHTETFGLSASSEVLDLKRQLAEKDKYWTTRIKQMHEEIADGYKSETARYAPYKELFSPLQLEAFQLAKELRAFLDKVGPCPKVEAPKPGDDNSEEAIRAFLDKSASVTQPWVKRLMYSYRAEFAERAIKITQRLAAENLPTMKLEQRVDALGSVDDIQVIAEQLCLMAARLDFSPERKRIRHEG